MVSVNFVNFGQHGLSVFGATLYLRHMRQGCGLNFANVSNSGKIWAIFGQTSGIFRQYAGRICIFGKDLFFFSFFFLGGGRLS